MKNMRIFLLGLAVVVVSALTAIIAAPALAETITLRLATYDPNTSMTVSGVPIFQKVVEEKSKGRLKIDWVGGPEVTGSKEQPAAVKRGVLDLSVAWAYVLHVPAYNAAHLSLLNPLEERKSGFYDLIVGEFEKKGFRYLARIHFGSPFAIVTTRKAEKPADLKGLGFRTSGIYEPIIDLVGGVKVRVSNTEVYTALQQGLIHARPAPMATVVAFKLYEVLKYWVGPAFFPAGNTILAMNLRKFNSLPADLQKVLVDAAEETERQLIPAKRRELDEAWREAQKGGMKRINWSKNVSQRFFNDVMDLSWKRVKKRVGEDLIKKMRPLMSK
ncbi:MAG: TRAP transporter substrate-binding protein DctP [Candidatus Binatia bacterium]